MLRSLRECGHYCRYVQEPFAYYTARGKLRYPVVSAFVGMWQNHYVTRSRQEYELKNARGDAQQIKRIDTRFPAGVDDVLNTYIITSVAARLARMHEDGYARQAEWLRKLLLSGAPNITSERLAAWPPENVFGDTFIRVGMQKQLSGEWPRF